MRLSLSSGSNRSRCCSFQMLAVMMLAAGSARAQVAPPQGGQVSIPNSSIEKPGDVGVRAHTNTQIFIPRRRAPTAPDSGSNGDVASPSPQSPKALDNPAEAQ